MAMNYTSLIADKGTAGSIAKWVNYTLLDTVTTLDEAQALIYMALRCREMRTALSFTMTQGMSYIDLPARFLDPIGRIRMLKFGDSIAHKDQGYLETNRFFTETSGTLGTDPYTTVLDSTEVTVALTDHGFSQGSIFYTTGATAVGGVTIEGTFEVTSVDTNTFTIDISALGAATSSATGGGAAVTYTCENINQGVPKYWAIYDERIYFDVAFNQSSVCRLSYYKSLPLLSATVQTNFLTSRYPHVLREACQAAAADFMKDDREYTKHVQALTGKIARVQAENEMGDMRGIEVDCYTP